MSGYPGKPLLGAEDTDSRAYWTCGYAPKPGGARCAAGAVWHGVAIGVDGLDHGAGLPCCDEHLPLMRLTADYVHAMDHPCCMPDALFNEDENVCVLPWDERALLSGEHASVVS